MVNIMHLVIQKILEKYQVFKIERIKKLAIARLRELEEAIDGEFDRAASQRLDQVNEWVRGDNAK